MKMEKHKNVQNTHVVEAVLIVFCYFVSSPSQPSYNNVSVWLVFIFMYIFGAFKNHLISYMVRALKLKKRKERQQPILFFYETPLLFILWDTSSHNHIYFLGVKTCATTSVITICPILITVHYIRGTVFPCQVRAVPLRCRPLCLMFSDLFLLYIHTRLIHSVLYTYYIRLPLPKMIIFLVQKKRGRANTAPLYAARSWSDISGTMTTTNPPVTARTIFIDPLRARIVELGAPQQAMTMLTLGERVDAPIRIQPIVIAVFTPVPILSL